jgi:serine/threonine-protein kinase
MAGQMPDEAIRKQIERILAHRSFNRSERMARFLRFAVEQAIEGHSTALKEYVIGVEVFDRNESYDPRIDPIVRVEARRLRAKVHAYYAADGVSDPVCIEFEPGSYVPRIYLRVTNNLQSEQARSVAVLPFSNLSGKEVESRFSDGLTEELIHTLTRLKRLRVLAWGPPDQKEGSERAGQLITGSVRISGAQLRVRAQFIDTRTGCYLWSETFDRPMRDSFAIQQDIAHAIACTLEFANYQILRPLVQCRRPAASLST